MSLAVDNFALIPNNPSQKQPKMAKSAVSSQASDTKGFGLNALVIGRCVHSSPYGVTDSYTRLSLIHNRIYIDKGTFLAKSPNSINRDWATRCKTGNALLDLHIKPFFAFIGAKRVTKVKIKLLDCVLANLLSAANSNSQLIYSRDSSRADYRPMMQVIDYLEHQNLVVNVIGKANEYQGNSSWMIATDKMKNEFNKARVKVALSNDASMVIVRDKDGKEKQLNRIKTRQPLKLKEASNPVQDYNATWLNHEVTLGGRHLVPFCRRIFNESLDYGGRFYGASHLTLGKATRAQILIDDEQTIEPDFKSLHYCLLYAIAGIQLDPLTDDPYLINGFSRNTAKLASLVLLNSEERIFKANVTKSGNPKNKAIMMQYKRDLELFIKRSSQGLEAKQPRKPVIAKGFIDGMPDNIQGADLYQAIAERHEAISYLFGAEKIGVTLQNTDSKIMAKTLQQLTALDIPTLPVHDSLRCKISDRDTVINAMNLAYKSVVGFDGCVTV